MRATSAAAASVPRPCSGEQRLLRWRRSRLFGRRGRGAGRWTGGRRAGGGGAGELSGHGHPVPFHVHALDVRVVVAPLLVRPGTARGGARRGARTLAAVEIVGVELLEALARSREREDAGLGGRCRARAGDEQG